MKYHYTLAEQKAIFRKQFSHVKGSKRKVLDIMLRAYPNEISATELKAKLKLNTAAGYYSALRNAMIFIDVNSRVCDKTAEKYYIFDKHLVAHRLVHRGMDVIS